VRLGEKQEIFSRGLSLLLDFAHMRGFSVRIGEVERSKVEARRKGFENSNHTRRLAVDLHLFRGGRYLSKTSDHEELGEFWESLSGSYGKDGTNLEFSWGGRFNDGNHYSIKHGRVR